MENVLNTIFVIRQAIYAFRHLSIYFLYLYVNKVGGPNSV